jgi:hypothetical protein
MRRFVSPFIAASLLLAPLNVLATPNQEFKGAPPQANAFNHPADCENIRVTLNNGRKIKSDSYRHQGDHVEITRKGIIHEVLDKDIKRIEVLQGSCPDIVLMLKSGERVAGYRRDHLCPDRYQCRTEINQQGTIRTIANSEIKTASLKFKKTFAGRLRSIALAPVYGLAYLILLILCSTGGCDEL